MKITVLSHSSYMPHNELLIEIHHVVSVDNTGDCFCHRNTFGWGCDADCVLNTVGRIASNWPSSRPQNNNFGVGRLKCVYTEDGGTKQRSNAALPERVKYNEAVLR